MSKTPEKKTFKLKKQTIRTLTTEELERVAGATEPTGGTDCTKVIQHEILKQ